MRVFFYFSWEFANFCHALAITMKKRFGVKEFSGLVIQKKQLDFLKKQKDVEYSHLYNVFAPYEGYQNEKIDKELLSRYESLYGNPTLWKLIYGDVEFQAYTNKPYSHEECMKLLQKYIKFTEDYLEESKPDYIIMENVVSMPSYVLFLVAKKKGIKIRIFTTGRINRRTVLSHSPFIGFEDVLKTFHDKNKKIEDKYVSQATSFLADFRNKKIDSDYMRSQGNFAEINYLGFSAMLRKVPRAIELIKQDLAQKKDAESFDKGTGFFSKFARVYRRHTLKYRTQLSRFFDKPVPGEDYAFFALHLEPEVATTVLAPMYINQFPLVESLAKSLPINYKLYVKDHPLTFSFGYGRDISYYQNMKKIPNVRILDPQLKAYPLIQNSKMVATINGTAGWEAVLLKKPVITFGDVFYNCLQGVTNCTNIPKLPETVFQALNAPVPSDDKELIRFCASFFKHSFEADYTAFCGINGWLSTEEILATQDFESAFAFLAKNLGLAKED